MRTPDLPQDPAHKFGLLRERFPTSRPRRAEAVSGSQPRDSRARMSDTSPRDPGSDMARPGSAYFGTSLRSAYGGAMFDLRALRRVDGALVLLFYRGDW